MDRQEDRHRIESGERLGLALVIIGVLGLLAIAWGITRNSGSDPERQGAAAVKREGRFRVCEARLRPPPMPITKRQRRNLGGNVMGESITYSDGTRKATLHIGYDALGAAEDIDLTETDTAFVGGRDFTLLQSKPLPDIWAATAQTGFLTPCDTVTLFTTGFGEPDLVAFLSRLRLQGQ
jgi:hypothetical protein